MKVVFIGEANVGKTTISYRMKEGASKLHGPTIAAGYVKIKTKHGDTIDIWDTSGSERFNALLPMYIRGAKIIVCVYDVLDEEHSLKRVEDYRKHFLETIQGTEDAIWMLVGNKVDRLTSKQTIKASKERGQEVADKYNMGPLFLVSALTGDGIDQLFDVLSLRAHEISTESKLINLSNNAKDGKVQLLQEEKQEIKGNVVVDGFRNYWKRCF